MNLIPGQILTRDDRLLVFFDSDQTVPVPARLLEHVSEGQKVTFGFRADDLMPKDHALPVLGEASELRLTVDIAEPLGTETLLFCNFAGVDIQAKMFNPRPVMPTEVMDFVFAIDKTHLFDAETGKSLRV